MSDSMELEVWCYWETLAPNAQVFDEPCYVYYWDEGTDSLKYEYLVPNTLDEVTVVYVDSMSNEFWMTRIGDMSHLRAVVALRDVLDKEKVMSALIQEYVDERLTLEMLQNKEEYEHIPRTMLTDPVGNLGGTASHRFAVPVKFPVWFVNVMVLRGLNV